MTRSGDFRAFGAYLREARKGRGLTLKEVAAASWEIARDPAGRISHPHLSQIENGKPIAIAPAKVLTLAAIYLRLPSEIADHAPEPVRSTLREGLSRWVCEGRPQPPFVRYLPRVVRQIEAEIDGLLEPLARSVRVPLGDEHTARWRIREGLVPAALPAFLHADTKRKAVEFWQTDASEEAYGRVPGTWWWHVAVTEYTNWLLYDRRAARELLSPIESWTIDFDSGNKDSEGTELLSCSFQGDELNRLYGFEKTPLALVRAVRWRQAARLLHSAGLPKRLRGVDEPPEPIDGLLDYVARLVSPVLTEPITRPGVPPGELVAALLDLRNLVPALKATPRTPDRTKQRAIASLLNRATDAASRTKRTR